MVNEKQDDVFEANFRFTVKAASQEEANLKIEATMRSFAKFMGWEQPDRLVRVGK